MNVLTNEMGAVQGDVPILRIDEQTPGGTLTDNRIVAYGEATGHHHELLGECEVYEVERSIEGKFFKGQEVVVSKNKPVYMYHKSSERDHDQIEFLPGLYFIPAPEVQQVEYDGEKERRAFD